MKRSGFKMRSGNTSTFKMMGSTSPMREEKTTIADDYQSTVNAVSDFKGTKEELRQFVLKNNEGKGASDKGRISQNMAIRIWRQNNPVENTTETPKVTTRKTRSGASGLVPTGTADKLAEEYGYGPDASGERTKRLRTLRSRFEATN